MKKIRIGIAGYGNQGKGVEMAILRMNWQVYLPEEILQQ